MMNQLLPINESEAILLALHDMEISNQLSIKVLPDKAVQFQKEHAWDRVNIRWETCAPGTRAGAVEWPIELPESGFDQFIFCLTVPPSLSVRFFTVDACGTATPLGEAVEGMMHRQEVLRPIPKGSISALRMEAYAHETGAQTIALTWFGLRNSHLAELVQKNKVRWNPEWSGLIKPTQEWGSPVFRSGLLFDAADLPALRAKKTLPGWSDHFAKLEKAARNMMERNPEDDLFISDYAPFTDERYVRESERGRAPFYYDSLKLALVGLINEDEAMIRHALRYLMCMLHLKHWSPSAETRLPGSTWDQRCFTEEMMTTSVVLLMDWLDHALTPRARILGHQMLWDRGLAIIERDMAKWEYVHHINQGPWFCRARVLAGLMLEKEWPRLGEDYVERAMTQLREGMDRYLLSDGGMDEGPMYFLLTFETILGAVIAYARKRGTDMRTLLPKAFPKAENYLRTVASTTPGQHIPDGDCASIYQNTDTCLILAALFPGSVYESLAHGALLSERPYTYSQHYVGTGVFSFILGPQEIAEPKSVAATFSLMPVAGLAGSFRTAGEHSLRLVFAGCKANPSHSHVDKGGFVAEVDGLPVFIDRGQVRYDDPRTTQLRRTENHNTFAPSFDGLTTEEQTTSLVPLIPVASGDENAFRASLNLSPVWQGSMRQCQRTLESVSVDAWTIEDAGELTREGQVVFFLQSHLSFEGEAGRWHCGPVRIEADWAERGDAAEHYIDCEFRPVYRLRLWSRTLTKFKMQTSFRRK